MKRIPLLLAVLTAIFLTICLFQLRGRGMGFVPPLTDWELHPAWWHFDFLADCADHLVSTPAFFILLLEAWSIQILGISNIETLPTFSQEIFVWIPFGLPIAIESLLVFCFARAVTLHISRHRKVSQETR
jgi:hypothetical protein